MKQHTKIQFNLQWTHDNTSPEEKQPIVKCYLDARWDREPTTIHLVKGGPQAVTVNGKISTKVKNLPPLAAIGFASFAWRKNECGNPCLMDTGTTHIFLTDVVNQLKKAPTYTTELKFRLHTVQGYEKGAVKVTFNREDFQLGLEVSNYVGNEFEQIGNLSVDYINSTYQQGQQMRDTFRGTERMRMPYDMSESGVESTGGKPLPAAAYVLSEIPKSNIGYWCNAYETVMKRDELNPKEWNRLNLVGKARATILTITYMSQYLDYIGDSIDRNVRGQAYQKELVEPTENFGDPLTTYSGDCEDLATGELQVYNAFTTFNFPKDEPRWKEMQQLASYYIPPLSLDVVNGQQVNNVSSLGAHMNDNFIPLHQFRDAMPVEGRDELPWNDANFPPEFKTLPFMIGEGTGMYEPLGTNNPVAAQMAYVYRCPSLEGFKKPISHKVGQVGSFFVGSLEGMTDYFYRRGHYAPLTFWYADRNRGNSRGVSYTDMINKPESLAIVPQPFISKKLMNHVEEVIKLRVPPKPLYLKEHHKREKNKHLDALCEGIAQLKREPGPPYQRVPVYVRPHQINAVQGSKILTDFKKLDRIWKVDYQLENITDEIWGYRMLVYVK